MRYFIQISYKGNKFKGWQRQKNTDGCIQSLIEDAIAKAAGINEIRIVGCGRTDAGVHAKKYYAHIDWPDENLLSYKDIINYILPNDIVVHDIIVVDQSAHARFDAITRTYEYHMHFQLDPFKAELSAYYNVKNLDIVAMDEACSLISQNTNFHQFCKTPLKNKNTLCFIKECTFSMSNDTRSAMLKISANRFLKSMVRVLVHDLLEIGTGKLSVNDLEQMFKDQKTRQIGKIAHPQGLYLCEISYRESIQNQLKG
jgi:tRNA pseudouridine38-40 synthase